MSEAIRCRIGDVVWCGRALTVASSVKPATLVRAVRGVSNRDSETRVVVTAADPGPAHEYVGCIHPERGLRTRTALAAAARSRGLETPHDAALARAREALDALGIEADDSAGERTQHRQAAAEATGESERLRERVAAARGRLRARREQGLDPTPAAEKLAEAIERLSEAETEAAAARQQLDTTNERTREHRDRREERLHLEDRVANLERKARAHRREQVREEYIAAVDAVPVAGDVGDPFGADPVTRSLAVARVADLSAPVVLACERFESADTAADWLDAPVLLCRGGDPGSRSR